MNGELLDTGPHASISKNYKFSSRPNKIILIFASNRNIYQFKFGIRNFKYPTKDT